MLILRRHAPLSLLLLVACSTQPGLPVETGRHIGATASSPASIPKPVASVPALPKPKAAPRTDTYSVVVSKLPVSDLLFALGRDAKINIDIHPGIEGVVTLNALNQTLQQILDRIGKQVDIRWKLDGGILTVEPDTPYLKTYHIDYFNIARSMKSNVSIANSIATTGSSATGSEKSNNSSTNINSEVQHHFWKQLESNLKEMLGVPPGLPSAPQTGAGQIAQHAGRVAAPAMSLGDTAAALAIADRLTKIEKTAAQAEKAAAETAALQSNSSAGPGRGEVKPAMTNQVIINPETGTLGVRAKNRDQIKVAEFLAAVQSSAQRQVLIEATVVEVTLSDRHQAGVDWSGMANNGRWSASQALSSTGFPSGSLLGMIGYNSSNFDITLKFLEQFGRTRVLSSPKVMALNNQTAVMKVVDEQVYFSLEIEEDKNTDGVVTSRTYTSEIHSVPVGLVMQVTPQIAASGAVTLNVRPTITNISGYVEDPAISLISAGSKLGIKSLVPNLQVREFDSTLKIPSGQTAILGGLIQDSQNNSRQGVPGFSRLPLIGDAFSYRDDTVKKIELVVFLKPVAIKEGGLDGELSSLQMFLPDQNFFNKASDHDLSAFRSGNIPAWSGERP